MSNNRMECKGMEMHGMEWNVMKWNGTKWNGMKGKKRKGKDMNCNYIKNVLISGVVRTLDSSLPHNQRQHLTIFQIMISSVIKY